LIPCFNLSSIDVTPESIAGFDCVVVGGHHYAFGFVLIKRHAKLSVDIRGVYLEPADNVVMTYLALP
jgi:UDP-N-acetyl-D-glucosamine dehydrogenase